MISSLLKWGAMPCHAKYFVFVSPHWNLFAMLSFGNICLNNNPISAFEWNEYPLQTVFKTHQHSALKTSDCVATFMGSGCILTVLRIKGWLLVVAIPGSEVSPACKVCWNGSLKFCKAAAKRCLCLSPLPCDFSAEIPMVIISKDLAQYLHIAAFLGSLLSSITQSLYLSSESLFFGIHKACCQIHVLQFQSKLWSLSEKNNVAQCGSPAK